MKIHPVGAELFLVDRQTHMMKLSLFTTLQKCKKKYLYLVRNPVYYIKGITFNYVRLIIRNYN
jgi:hypothetical protein